MNDMKAPVDCGAMAEFLQDNLPEAPKYTPKALKPFIQDGHVTTPLPGVLLRICVRQGQKVQAGDTLAIVEAMKMENELYAPFDGVVEMLPISEGEKVKAGQVIVVVCGGAQA